MEELEQRARGLLPCPFCGASEASAFPPTCDRHTPYDPGDRAFPVVRCGGCYAEVPGKDWDRSCKSADAAWNRRALMSALSIARSLTAAQREAVLNGDVQATSDVGLPWCDGCDMRANGGWSWCQNQADRGICTGLAVRDALAREGAE